MNKKAIGVQKYSSDCLFFLSNLPSLPILPNLGFLKSLIILSHVDESITDSHVDVTEAAAQRAENMALDKASESGDASAFAVAVTSGDDADGEVDGKHGGSLTSRGSEAPGEIQGTESKPELKSKSPLTEQASELSAKDTSQAVTASFQKRDSDDMEASEQGKPDAKNSAWSGPKELPRSKLSDYLENHVKRCVECSLP